MPAVTNKNNTLYHIPHILKESANVRFSQKFGGGNRCILVAVIRSISSSTGIPPQILANHLKSKSSTALGGYTLQEVFDNYSNAVVTYNNNKRFMFNLSLDEYKSKEEVITQIQNGNPVIMIVGSYGNFVKALLDIEDDVDTDGILPESILKGMRPISSKGGSFHSLILFAYDKKYQLIIGREEKEQLAYKGYFKFNEKYVNSKYMKLFGIKVEDFVSL